MADSIDPRHLARAIALQKLFNKLIPQERENRLPQEEFSSDDLLEMLEGESYNAEIADSIYDGVQDKVTEIDAVIRELAPAWPINQIAPVDLIVLRMSIWEAFVARLTPERVVINEGIELAKQFGGANSSSFINGVLGTLLNREDLQFQLNPNPKPVFEEDVTAEEADIKPEDTETSDPSILM